MTHPYNDLQANRNEIRWAKEDKIKEVSQPYDDAYKNIKEKIEKYQKEYCLAISKEILRLDPSIVQWSNGPIKFFTEEYFINVGFGCTWSNIESYHDDPRFGVSYLEYPLENELDRLILESEIRKLFSLSIPNDNFNNHTEVAQDLITKIKAIPELVKKVNHIINHDYRVKASRWAYFNIYKTQYRYYFGKDIPHLMDKTSEQMKEIYKKQVDYLQRVAAKNLT